MLSLPSSASLQLLSTNVEAVEGASAELRLQVHTLASPGKYLLGLLGRRCRPGTLNRPTSR